MYRVIEVARLLGTSKVTVYKKMELLKKELKPYLKHRSNIIYIEEPGVELIRSTLNSAAVNPQLGLHQVNSELLKPLNSNDSTATSEPAPKKASDAAQHDLLQHLEILQHLVRTRQEEVARKESQLKQLQRLVKWNRSSIGFTEGIRARLSNSSE